MKFNVKLFILTILVLSGLNLAKKNLYTSSRVHKSHNHRTLSSNQSKTQLNLADVLVTIKEIFQNPAEFLMSFVIGALSAYDENFKILYEKYTKVKVAVQSCIEEINKANEDTTQAKFSGSDFERNMDNTDPAKKKAFCEACQETTEEWKSYFSKNKNGDGVWGSMISGIYTVSSSKERTCSYVLEGLTDAGNIKVDQKCKDKLYKQFKSNDNWMRECRYIMSLDCNEYNPQYGEVKSIGEKVFKYWKKIGAGFKCISSPQTKIAVKAIIGVGAFNSIYGNALVSGLSTIFGGVAGAVANVMTLGIWGAIKGGYYLVKTGLLIADFLKNPEPYLKSYLVGKITGNLIIMLKSFTLGKRKLKKFRKH
jgi:hypothetical protein